MRCVAVKDSYFYSGAKENMFFRVDDPIEDINKCLTCQFRECINCLEHKPKRIRKARLIVK